MAKAWNRQQFEQALRDQAHKYHIHHPYQQMMRDGELNQRQIQGWVQNRYYYQIMIPQKDANLLAKCPDREVRRRWMQRMIDHDGRGGDEGGIECWIRLGEAVGLSREEVVSQQGVLPAVRFAVDAYVNFVRTAPWQEGVASSLTELFAPTVHRERISTWPEQYPWIDQQGLEYFQKRLGEAHRDVEHGLEITLDYFTTREQQDRVMALLQFKLDILWSMLDAMYMAYVNNMPPYFNVISE